MLRHEGGRNGECRPRRHRRRRSWPERIYSHRDRRSPRPARGRVPARLRSRALWTSGGGPGVGGTRLGCALHGRDRRAGRRATCCLAATLKAIEAAEAPGPDAVDLLPKWYSEVGLLHDRLRVRRMPTPRPPRHARTRLHPCQDALGVVLVNGAAAGTWAAPLRGAYGGRAEHVRSS